MKLIKNYLILFIPMALLHFACASTIVNTFIKYERYRSNLTKKSIQVENHLFTYLEGGTGTETILLIHGFSGEKEHWTRFSKYLTNKYRVIVPDIPPFGESTKIETENYGITNQVNRLHLFAEKLSLKKYHIVGNSMGGHIAGAYAIEYPDEILSLGLFDAAGVKSPRPSKLSVELASGRNPLIVNSKEEFDSLMKFTFVDPPYIPGIVKSEIANKAIKNRDFYDKVFSEITKKDYSIENKLSKIKAKTLILWGDTDNIIDVSAVEVFEKGISNHQTIIMEKCGHGPMVERPEEAAKHYIDFINPPNAK
jgi:pimeloyl-ACP methyl ester carboxylesterase